MGCVELWPGVIDHGGERGLWGFLGAFTDKYVTAMLKNNGSTQRTVRRPDHVVERVTAARLQPDEAAGRDHAGQRRLVAGYPSDATDNAVQADIVAAG